MLFRSLPAVPGGIFVHRSGREHKLVAEGRRNGTTGVKQRFKVDLGGLLKTESGFAPVAPVRVTAGKQLGFGNPDAVFVLPELHFGERNDHRAVRITPPVRKVKREVYA
mgnify:CR=1 FL=1